MTGRFVYDFDEPTDGGRELLGRQGHRPGRNDAARRAGARRVHDHDRRLPGVHGGGRRAPRRARGGDRGAPGHSGGEDRQAVRRFPRSAARLGPLRRGRLDAGDDGHDPQPGPERRRRRRARRAHGKRAVCKRLVPPPDPDVRRSRRKGGRGGHLFEEALVEAESSEAPRRRRLSAEDLAEPGRDVQEDLRGRDRRLRSRRTRGPSSRAPSAPSSSRGTTRARRSTAAHHIPDDLGTAVNVVQMVFGNKGERSGTGASPSRATLDRASPASTGSSSPMLRARTSFPGSARRSTSRPCRRRFRRRSSS